MPTCAMASSSRRRRAAASVLSLFCGALMRELVTIVATRRLWRDVARGHVPCDGGAIALLRITPAAAAGGAEGEPVAGREHDSGRLQQPLRAAVAPREDRLVDSTGFA